MKKIFISLALICAMVVCANAQNYTKSSDGKTYSAVKKTTESSERETGFTWKDSKGNTYPIYMGKTGSCYIKKISKKSGNEYKQYLGEEISRDICKQLNVEYTGKSSK